MPNRRGRTTREALVSRRAAEHPDDVAFRASLAPHHDEHVAEGYWHAGCDKCAAEQVAESKSGKRGPVR